MPSNAPPKIGRRPFPWHCPNCGKKDVNGAVVDYTTQVKHDGKMYDVHIAELDSAKCGSCGELVFDDVVGEQIAQALQAQLRLLTPEQIRRAIATLGMTQKELAARLGIAEATLSRWCTGALIQSRAMDNYLRSYFAVPELRNVLVGPGQDCELGTMVAQTEARNRTGKRSGNAGRNAPCGREDASCWRVDSPIYQETQRIIRESGTTWGSREVA